eukprot:scaffold6224_cov102-Skeletonema_marinoi.AAC.1
MQLKYGRMQVQVEERRELKSPCPAHSFILVQLSSFYNERAFSKLNMSDLGKDLAELCIFLQRNRNNLRQPISI